MIYDLQKASMWKRISAFLFDGILLGIAAVFCAFLLSWVVDIDGCNAKLNGFYQAYAEKYQVDFNMSLEEYESLAPDESVRLENAYHAMAGDAEAVHAYELVMQLTIMITSLGILMGFLIIEFIIPLCFKNGQTLGKKIFGLAVMRTDGVKLSAVSLFIRTLLGKYTFETMLPLLLCVMIFWGNIGLIGPLILGSLLIAEAVIIIATRTNALIHDLLAGTVVVDFASQLIFDTKEELLAYKQKVHAELAARQDY